MDRVNWLRNKLLHLKYRLKGLDPMEASVRSALCNFRKANEEALGLLITQSFLASGTMRTTLRVALRRLRAQDSLLFSKTMQFRNSLLLLQKMSIESLWVRKEIRANLETILRFVFYKHRSPRVTREIRAMAISIIKTLDTPDNPMPLRSSAETFFSCISHSTALSPAE